jgi:hypothetical protein
MPMPQEAVCSRCGHQWTYSEQDVLPDKSCDDDWSGKSSVYLIVNKVNRRIYVGQTRRGLHALMMDYGYESERAGGRLWPRQGVVSAMSKFGIDAFDMILLATGGREIERNWISKLNATDPKIGYNGRSD